MAINFESFVQTEEWQQLIQFMKEMEKDFVKDIIKSGADGNVAQVQHLTGKIAMMEELKDLPDRLVISQRQNRKGVQNASED